MRLLEILNQPWAILPENLLEIREIYLTHLRGDKIDIHKVEDRLGRPLSNEQKSYAVVDGVAVLPIDGVLAKRMNLFTQISGGASTQILTRDFNAAMGDAAVHSIVLLVDSPGGEVDGTQEFAHVVQAARGNGKQIVTLAESMMASAAYWIGSAADKVFMTGDTTAVGSIGVVATHTDYSGAEAKKGITITEITAGKYKRVASEHAPLSTEGRADIQEKVDHIYSVFVNDVAANRGVPVDKVLTKMADGKLFYGKNALDAGLVDGYMALGDLIARLNYARLNGSTAAFADDFTMTEGTSMAEPKNDAGAAVKVYTEAQVAELAAKAATDVITARTEGTAEGYLAGATAERDRIKAVQEQHVPGHEALIEEMKFDGKTTGPEAAVKVLAADKKVRKDKLADLHADAPPPVGTGGTPGAPTTAANIDPLVVAKKAREYQDAEIKAGREISTTEAVAHVMAQMKAGR